MKNFGGWKNLVLALGVLILGAAQAQESTLSMAELKARFVRTGGNAHAFDHVACFLREKASDDFIAFTPHDQNFVRRCSQHGSFRIENQRFFSIIDYTKPSNTKRLFLIDRQTGEVSTTAVAHGKFEAGQFSSRLSSNRNSVREIQYYSNEIDSNASSSGFFVSGQEYDGKFGRSLVLFGLEEGINHNACERAIVIHSHLMVSRDRARIMSSGCPMVHHSFIDYLIDRLGGQRLAQNDIGLKKTGGLVFIYSQREAQLPPCYSL
jgi:hypothetical protein